MESASLESFRLTSSATRAGKNLTRHCEPGIIASLAATPDEKGARDKPRAPNPITSPLGEDYIEAAEAADEAAPAAAVAADEAESAEVEAPEAAEAAIEAELSADEAIESTEAVESAEEDSAWLQAERVSAAPATAAARTILRMYGIP